MQGQAPHFGNLMILRQTTLTIVCRPRSSTHSIPDRAVTFSNLTITSTTARRAAKIGRASSSFAGQQVADESTGHVEQALGLRPHFFSSLLVNADYFPVSCAASFSFSAQNDSSTSLSGIRCCFIRTVNGRV